jgi:hypothetical protein
MLILGIDPGAHRSAFALLDTDKMQVVSATYVDNAIINSANDIPLVTADYRPCLDVDAVAIEWLYGGGGLPADYLIYTARTESRFKLFASTLIGEENVTTLWSRNVRKRLFGSATASDKVVKLGLEGWLAAPFTKSAVIGPNNKAHHMGHMRDAAAVAIAAFIALRAPWLVMPRKDIALEVKALIDSDNSKRAKKSAATRAANKARSATGKAA